MGFLPQLSKSLSVAPLRFLSFVSGSVSNHPPEMILSSRDEFDKTFSESDAFFFFKVSYKLL